LRTAADRPKEFSRAEMWRAGTTWHAPADRLLAVTYLDVRIRYYTDGFWIHPDLLGYTSSWQQADGTVTHLSLPTEQTDFSAGEHETEFQPGPAWLPVATFNEPGRDIRTVAVHLFKVEVELEHDLPIERPDLATNPGYVAQASEACKKGQLIAEQTAFEFLRWMRARSSQTWLGLLAERPRQYGRGGLYYHRGGDVMGFGTPWSRTFRPSQLRFEREDLDFIVDKVVHEKPVLVSDELLADARHLIEGAEVPDIQRSIITAAIACEVRTTEVLLDRVMSDREPLLRLLLKQTSRLPFILDKVMETAFGLSLRVDDRELYGKVEELMRQRNAVVHEGAPADLSKLRGGPALVATNLYSWLDEKVR